MVRVVVVCSRITQPLEWTSYPCSLLSALGVKVVEHMIKCHYDVAHRVLPTPFNPTNYLGIFSLVFFVPKRFKHYILPFNILLFEATL